MAKETGLMASAKANRTAAPPAFVVTVDGPAASGKSSVSREVAGLFGWSWVSTGAFYRGLALVAQLEATDLGDEPALARLATTAGIWSVALTPKKTRVLHRGRDIGERLAREEVGSLASRISSFPLVRQALLEAQRRCATGVAGLVAEGRDCGSVVFPSAPVKVFLTARAEDRAARRAKEEGLTVIETREAQRARDAQDATRAAAPMVAPPGSHLIDTSVMSLAQVISAVEALIRAKIKSLDLSF